MVDRAAVLLHVDAFTGQAFAGNPAAVCLLDGASEVSWMQAVAAEMNLSETAFVAPTAGSATGATFAIRWFTPTVEVDLCGHATLASAHALWQLGRVPREQQIRFSSRSGSLGAVFRDDEIELDFPARRVEPQAPPAGLLEALGVMPVEVLRTGDNDCLVAVADAQAVRELQPALDVLATIEARAVVVSAPGVGVSRADGASADCVSRVFAPAVGVPEDPVTGSAHCALAVYWGERLRKQRLLGYQASKRGGWVSMERDGDRVRLGGRAVTVARGSLLV